jgi:hypothetical protein
MMAFFSFTRLLTVDPLPRDAGADVGLVLMVGGNDVDLPALGGHAGILDRHLGRKRGACAAEIGVKPRIIGQDADLHGFVLRKGAAVHRERECCAKQKSRNSVHHISSVDAA